MKILYNIATTSHSGGMERVLANKANYLTAHGYEVVIVSTDRFGHPPFFHLDERIRQVNLHIEYEENNGKSLWNKLLHFPLKQWKHKKRLTEVLMRERPDITISMFNHDASFVTRIKDGSVKLLEIHFSKFKRLQYNRKGLWRLVDLWLTKQDEKTTKRFDRFVVLTQEDKENWGCQDNICVIPNANTFSPKQTASLDDKKVIAVGRYSYQKGFDRLINAWKIVDQVCPEWTLEIIGDGDEKPALQNLIDCHELNEKVKLMPATSAIEDVYLGASVVALSSHYEGLPMVLLEAQSFGLPIVAFACQCGPKDIVADGETGFLVPEGDVRQLADRLINVMTNEQLRKTMGKRAKETSRRFEEGAVMQQWIDTFNTLTK